MSNPHPQPLPKIDAAAGLPDRAGVAGGEADRTDRGAAGQWRKRPATELVVGTRFSAAVAYVVDLHAAQRRKVFAEPYVAHLLAVASLVLESGGSEEQAIAALLHDAFEDQGGEATLQQIAARFGPTVARWVRDCSDHLTQPKPPWPQRKAEHRARLEQADPQVCLIVAADLLHNARCLVMALRAHGPHIWQRFSGGQERTLAHYRALVDLFDRRGIAPFLLAELRETIARIESLSAR